VRLGSVISGELARPKESRVLQSRNPANLGEVVAEVELADPAIFLRACRAARQGQPGWASLPPPLRGRVIQQVGRLVEANKQALAELVTRETGKPLRESFGEVQEVIDTCTFFLGEGRRLYGQTVPSEMPDKQLFTFRRPLGVVAVVTAANFPVAVPSWYVVPALLCGNTVVWKPSEQAGAVAQALAELLWHGGVPADALQLVQADGQATFAGLELALEAGLVDKLGFTGSTAVGRRLGELCGRHLQSPCLELGGKNPLVVAPDADLDLTVEGALFSGFGTAGQRCTSLGTAIVHHSVYDDFLERFDRAVSSAPIGDPFQDVLYGPLLGEAYLERFEGFLGMVAGHHKRYGSTGVGRVTATNPRQGMVGNPEAGLYAHPTVVAGVTAGDELYRTETFGPIVGVAAYGSLDEAVALANGHGYGLSAAIYTRDPRTAFEFAERCAAGMVSVNNSTSGAEAHLPFGGNGLSGNGSRQSGIWVLEQFTSWQALNWDYSGKLQKAQMDVPEPPSDLNYRIGGKQSPGDR
jgi:aldehyde dehydrogenase (NAD+)